MEDIFPVLLAGTIGGIRLYKFDGEYEVYEGDHCTIFDNEEDARAYYNVACSLSNMKIRLLKK